MLNFYNTRQKNKISCERVVASTVLTKSLLTDRLNHMSIKSDTVQPVALVSQSESGEIKVGYPYRCQYYQIGPNVTVWGSVVISKEQLNGPFPSFSLHFDVPELPYGVMSPEFRLPVSFNSRRNFSWNVSCSYGSTPMHIDRYALVIHFETSDTRALSVHDDEICFQAIYSTLK